MESNINIIGNNCIGGFLYKNLFKMEYQNPFIWIRILNNHFINLIENFEIIDFKNYELKAYKTLDDFRLLIDNKTEIEFVHMKFEQNASTPIVDGVFVYYNKIWEYIIEKYEARLKRMKSSIDLVAIDDHECYNYDLKKILDICKNKSIKCFICTNRLQEQNTNDLLIVRRNKQIDADEGHPDKIVEIYKNEILEFVNEKPL